MSGRTVEAWTIFGCVSVIVVCILITVPVYIGMRARIETLARIEACKSAQNVSDCLKLNGH